MRSRTLVCQGLMHHALAAVRLVGAGAVNSGQDPDGELLRRGLTPAVVDTNGEREGARRRGCAEDTTGERLHPARTP